MIGDYQRDIADRALSASESSLELAKSANAVTQDALRIGEEAVALLTEARTEAAKLTEYFARMSIANDRESRPGDVVYTGAQAFRHASELLAMLARGEKIL